MSVFRRLRVAFFSTGDELVSIGSPLGEGQIYDSNRYTIHGMLTRLNCEVLDLGVVRDDPAVTVRPVGGDWSRAVEPSAVSSTRSPGWGIVAAAARAAWGEGDLVVAPYLLTGATDARHLAPLADDVYRFTGYTLTSEDASRFHGLDERIAVADYARVIEVYWRVLRGLDALEKQGVARPAG